MNLLFILVDQFRADLLSGRLADSVATPNLDQLAARARRYANHHTVAVPCGPARASLFTGLLASEHGAVRNGMPLKSGLTNIAHQLRRIGREPLLFGYTDTQPDPAHLFRRDPANRSYTAPMEGFTEVVEMREEAWRWRAHLRACGYDVPQSIGPELHQLYRPQGGALGGPALYDASHSDTAYLTDETIRALDIRKSEPWSAFVTYIRPHPPFVAPAPYHDMIDPGSLPPPLQADCNHPFLEVERTSRSQAGMFWGFDGNLTGLDSETINLIRATYLGLVAELDANIGRVLNWLDATGQGARTMIVFSADHGEMLGDFGLWGKLSPFPQASHVPLMLAGPDIEPGQVGEVTQSTDLMKSVLDYLEGGQLGVIPAESPRVEMSLSNATQSSRFQSAWHCEDRDLMCTVSHDESNRTAHFDGVVPELRMCPKTGVPQALDV